MSRHPIRWLATAALALLLFELGMNAFLLSGALGRAISSNPDRLLVTYRTGWSIVPGHVHARDLRIRSKDGSLEFDLRIDSCDFEASLADLLGRRFHVTSVTGRGVRFVARRRLDPADVTARVRAAIPPIEGLEQVPLKGPPTPPPDDAHYNLFTVQLDRVDAQSVREIWVDTMRFVGEAHVRGGFYLRPVRWASIGPVVAEVAGGKVTSATDVIADDLSGRIETTVEGFDPRYTEGSGVLRRTDARLSLSGRVDDLASVEHAVSPEANPPVRAGRGSFDTHLELEGGVARGAAAIALDHVQADFGAGDTATGTVRARFELRRASVDDATIDMAGSRVEVLGVAAMGGTQGWWADVRFPQAILTNTPATAWHGQLELHARDTRPFAGAFVASRSWPQWLVPILTSGDLHARAAVHGEPSTVVVQDLVATTGPYEVAATVVARGASSHVVALVEDGPWAVGIESRNGEAHVQLVDPAAWYAAQKGAALAPASRARR